MMSKQSTSTSIRGAAIAASLALCLNVGAAPAPEPEGTKDSGATGSTKDRPAAEASEAAPVYRPPRRGAPKTRVGGGTRDPRSDAAPSIVVLAPMSTGLTTRASPTLYWYLSKPYEGTFEFVIMDRDSVAAEPLFRQRTDARFAADYHAFELSQVDVELEEGHVYQWSVVLVRNPQRRSQDIVGSATVERTGSLQTAVVDRSRVSALAGAGLWYDAIEALLPPPTTELSRTQLAALLGQVGLGEVGTGG